jgi:hypothetical protein
VANPSVLGAEYGFRVQTGREVFQVYRIVVDLYSINSFLSSAFLGFHDKDCPLKRCPKMAIVVPYVAAQKWLRALRGDDALPTQFDYAFYTNDLDPDNDTVKADFTAVNPLLATPFDVLMADAGIGDIGSLAGFVWDQETVPISNTVSLFGYFVLNHADGALWWAERFDGAPYSWGPSGGELKITPRIALTYLS